LDFWVATSSKSSRQTTSRLTSQPVASPATAIFLWSLPLPIEMMQPDEIKQSLLLSPWDSAELLRSLSSLDMDKVAADLKPIVARLKSIGALEPEFTL
jgi:hypothetical protein